MHMEQADRRSWWFIYALEQRIRRSGFEAFCFCHLGSRFHVRSISLSLSLCFTFYRLIAAVILSFFFSFFFKWKEEKRIIFVVALLFDFFFSLFCLHRLQIVYVRVDVDVKIKEKDEEWSSWSGPGRGGWTANTYVCHPLYLYGSL